MNTDRIRVSKELLEKVDRVITVELERNKKSFDTNGLLLYVIDEYIKQKNYNFNASESTIDTFNNFKKGMTRIVKTNR